MMELAFFSEINTNYKVLVILFPLAPIETRHFSSPSGGARANYAKTIAVFIIINSSDPNFCATTIYQFAAKICLNYGTAGHCNKYFNKASI